MRLEGKALVDEQFLQQVEVLPDEEMPLMLIAQMANQELVAYYDEAIALELQKELAANFFEGRFPKFDSLLSTLRSHGLSFEVGHYRTYVFPSRPVKEAEAICFSRDDPSVKAIGFDGFTEKVYAIEQDGKPVSTCVSARENESCGET